MMQQEYPSRPSFVVRLDFLVATPSHVSIENARQSILDILSRPIAGQCIVPECPSRRSFERPVRHSNYDNRFWRVHETSPAQPSADLPSSPADLQGQDIRLHRLTIASPTPSHWTATAANATSYNCACSSLTGQVKDVINRLYNANLHTNRDLLAVYTDLNCRFRVCISSGTVYQTYSRKVMSDIMRFFLMFERTFDSIIQDVTRIRRGQLDALAHEKALRTARNDQARIDVCLKLPTNYSAVNMLPVLYHAHQSIEFLQHPATLDYDEVVAWINACVGIVAWLEDSDYNGAYRYMEDKWFDIQHSLPQLLAEINVDTKTVEHYSNVLTCDTEYTYEMQKYERALNETRDHPLRDLLVGAAQERYRRANRFTIGMATTQKIMLGEYGWLPAGSPVKMPHLPSVNVEDGMTWMVMPANTEPTQAMPVLSNVVAIKNISISCDRWRLLTLIEEKALPMPIRLNYVYTDGGFIGIAFANYRNGTDASSTIQGLDGAKIGGRRLKVEHKRLQSRMERNLKHHERRQRASSGKTSSTELETASWVASVSTGDADVSSDHTEQTSISTEAGNESVISGSDEYHSCLEWSSPERSP